MFGATTAALPTMRFALILLSLATATLARPQGYYGSSYYGSGYASPFKFKKKSFQDPNCCVQQQVAYAPPPQIVQVAAPPPQIVQVAAPPPQVVQVAAPPVQPVVCAQPTCVQVFYSCF